MEEFVAEASRWMKRAVSKRRAPALCRNRMVEALHLTSR